MILSAEILTTFETCPRRYIWTNRYKTNRVSVIGALYRALDAGLRSDKSPELAAENEFMSLAASPGLDVEGRNVYAIAMHHAKLAGIIAVSLRSAFKAPWSAFPDSEVVTPDTVRFPWRSGLLCAENGIPRRVVLVDRWSDDRRMAELRGWRMIGELLTLRKPILLTAVTIGASRDGWRHSAWTRCYQHPKNHSYRFRRKNSSEDFGKSWEPVWRENSGISTAEWLTQMQNDDCMGELIQTVEIPPMARRDDYISSIRRMVTEMERWQERQGETPPMRLAGCSPIGGSPCPFIQVCHGKAAPIPENYGFKPCAPIFPRT